MFDLYPRWLIILSVGLALEKWTGGQFKATLHRVVMHTLPDGSFKGRKSIAYFVQPEDSVASTSPHQHGSLALITTFQVFNPIQADGEIIPTPGALTSKAFFLERLNATMVAAA